ncbi:MAG: NAD(P)H-hydrate epimerase [Candidatus Dormiibacterota bacterium]
MTSLATREAARALDGAAVEMGVPVQMLMALAGFQCASLARELLLEARGRGASAAVLVGRGNNGGDALVCARHLQDWGFAVRILLPVPAPELGASAGLAGAAVSAGALAVALTEEPSSELATGRVLEDTALVVDGLLGTGSAGAPREPVAGVIRRVNRSSATVLAVDLPSGLDADTGTVAGECIRAHHTLMLGAPKVGCLQPPARHWVGRAWLADIGIPRAAYLRAGLDPPLVRGPAPVPCDPPG